MLLGIWLMIYGCRKFKSTVAVVIMMVVIFGARMSKPISDNNILVVYIGSIFSGGMVAKGVDYEWTKALLFIGGLKGLDLCVLMGSFLPLPANFISTEVAKGIATGSFVIGAFVFQRMERTKLADVRCVHQCLFELQQ